MRRADQTRSFGSLNLFRILAVLAMFLVGGGDLFAQALTRADWASLLHGARSALGKVHVDQATLQGMTLRPIPNPSGSGFILRASAANGQFANLSHPTLRAYLDQIGTRVFPSAEAAQASAGAYRGHLTRQVGQLNRHYAGEIGNYSRNMARAPAAPAQIAAGTTPRALPAAANAPTTAIVPANAGTSTAIVPASSTSRAIVPVTPGSNAIVPANAGTSTALVPVNAPGTSNALVPASTQSRALVPVTQTGGAGGLPPGGPPPGATTGAAVPPPGGGPAASVTAANPAAAAVKQPGMISRFLSNPIVSTGLTVLGHAGTGQGIVAISDMVSGRDSGATGGMGSFVGSLVGAGGGYWLGSVVAGALGPYGNLAKAGLAIAGGMMGTRAGAGQNMEIGKALFSAAAAVAATAGLAALVAAGAPAILGGAIVGFIASTVAGVAASVLWDKLMQNSNPRDRLMAAARSRFSGNRVFAGGTTNVSPTGAAAPQDPAGVTLLQNSAATN